MANEERLSRLASDRVAARRMSRYEVYGRTVADRAGVLRFAALALAANADVSNPNTSIQSCFGIASGQRASTLHDSGQHASSFDEPRIGIGNRVFHVLGFDSVGAAWSALASIDGIDATHCRSWTRRARRARPVRRGAGGTRCHTVDVETVTDETA